MAALAWGRTWIWLAIVVTALLWPVSHAGADADDDDGRSSEAAFVTPSGQRITPLATPRARFEQLDPEVRTFPDFRAGYAVSTAVSPDRKTLLVLTSGYNYNTLPDASAPPQGTAEFVFVYDISGDRPVKRQVLRIPNSFLGIAFHPSGDAFYVSGGGSDEVFMFARGRGGQWVRSGDPIPLGHASGLGLFVGEEPTGASGLAVTANGKRLVVANMQNDSITVVDLERRKVAGELDLRPGRTDSAKRGVPGGAYPWWVTIQGSDTAYVSSVRDREVVVVELAGRPWVAGRIPLAGNPNKMILDRSGATLFVAEDNTDTVAVIDTRTRRIVERISTIAPPGLLAEQGRYTGVSPNDLALSPDERFLYVTNGGANALAVIRRGAAGAASQVLGLIPTGWSPNSVATSRNGRMLFIVNGKGKAGPTPRLWDIPAGDYDYGANQYVLQLMPAGLLSLPVPGARDLGELTRQVAANNRYTVRADPRDERVMAALRQRIKHVIYVIKENRTYDQILGDLDRGNGDPGLVMFGQRVTPNQHRLARRFVNLDNFYCSGDVSGDGWPWSTAARASDFTVKAVPWHYGGRGGTYDWEGYNRNLNVGIADIDERRRADPRTPDDPDLLPGAANVAEPDGPAGTPRGKGYLWDAALRAGLTIRAYGVMGEIVGDEQNPPRYPGRTGTVVASYNNPELRAFGNPYYRGYDDAYPDFYRIAEWEREFDQFIASGQLPNLMLVQLPGNHTGEFETAIDGVNTPTRQIADNDLALGRLVQRVAQSPFKDSTLVISLEDDAQDGPDHVDAHRSIAFFAGPYVKRGAVISERYTTVNVIRTIEDILGLDHLNLNTATQRPMTEVFDLAQTEWSFEATIPAPLRNTALPLDRLRTAGVVDEDRNTFAERHDGTWWAEQTAHLDFAVIDGMDSNSFNLITWRGIMGEVPYPTERSGQDLSQDRAKLLREAGLVAE